MNEETRERWDATEDGMAAAEAAYDACFEDEARREEYEAQYTAVYEWSAEMEWERSERLKAAGKQWAPWFQEAA